MKIAAIITAAVSAAVFTISDMPVSAEKFVEYTGWADIADVVACSRAASGDPVSNYKWGDAIRLDVDFDGNITQHDADIMLDYICMYDMFDTVCEIAYRDWFTEMQDVFRMEMAETYNTPIQFVSVFYGFRPDQVIRYYPDYLMIDRVFTIADGGMTGYAIQEDPYFGDILYKHDYNCGDIVVIYNVYSGCELVRQDEFKVGDTGEFGIDYKPRAEIVQNALRNLE